jgi:N-acetyl-anhydromuramyl-L-alanine amidase AmpD
MGLMDDIGDVARKATYIAVLRNLLSIKKKPGQHSASRGTTVIDEIVLHGTESKGTQEQSADSLTGMGNSIHYFIGRDQGLAYSIISEDLQAVHAGNPAHHPTVQNHNPRSIGIEMYQKDISMFKGDASKLDFTDWQYDTVAMLVYDIRRRRKIARDMVVGHSAINSIDRADPRNFDWSRFNRKVDEISSTLGRLLGPEFQLDPMIPLPLMMMPIRGW